MQFKNIAVPAQISIKPCVPLSTLVGERPPFIDIEKKKLFVTISPNPMVKIWTFVYDLKGNKIRIKLPYKNCKPIVQYEYCMKLLKRHMIIAGECETVGTWEFNKSGLVHFHYLLYSPGIQDDVDMTMFRKNIGADGEILKHLTRDGKDYCNNIVFLNKPINEIVEYMDKEFLKTQKYFPNYVYSNLITD